MRKYTTLVAGGAGFVVPIYAIGFLQMAKGLSVLITFPLVRRLTSRRCKQILRLTSFYMMWSSLCMSIML